MKGVVVVGLALAFLGCMSFVFANPPLTEPLQYEQLCEDQKIAGTGIIDISTSIIDKRIALEYYNMMSGDGDLELDQVHAYSQKAIPQNVTAISDGHSSKLNLLDKTKLVYNSATTPLTGGKYLNSKAFYGGIGANAQEMFSAKQIEKDQTAFFVSTADIIADYTKQANMLKQAGLEDLAEGNEDRVRALLQGKKINKFPNNHLTPNYLTDQEEPSMQNYSSSIYQSSPIDSSTVAYSGITPLAPIDASTLSYPSGFAPMPADSSTLYIQLRKTTEALAEEPVVSNPVHVIGIDTKSSFNGTWGIDANWHKIFSKDIKVHEMFTGTFEAEKLIKFHEYPVPETAESPCKGIDC